MNHGIARKRVMAEMEQVIDRLRLESAIVALGAMIRATVEMRNYAVRTVMRSLRWRCDRRREFRS